METEDGRRIISGFYSTKEERKACLSLEQWSKWKQLEKTISVRDTGTKAIVHGRNRNQHSIVGTPGEINPWGHSEGTIGNTIDYCVQLGIFTKDQIKILAGTKMNKINSHLRSMEKKGEYVAIKNFDGIISFKNK
ncbi:hypothetical protein [Desulfobacula sp.]|uniref:hypothetical protein n=1 Tax=Desulfobacula sp. TaxID=2593537 RepID=UPI0025C64DF6|nr:hypothetical protein [Desulfobacula sp.]MBC2703436.1 hypothetical protein [Desulfobacula sp.]